MRVRFLAIIWLLGACASSAMAQGIVTPPTSTFQPDSALPSVKVPEFVITGKTQVSLPKAAKPTVKIDSSYFQDKKIRGVEAELPLNRDLSRQNIERTQARSGLFARASFGHYTTTNYLVSGTESVGGFDLNGSVSGDYTSGFIPNTLSRGFSIQAGLSKDIDSREMIKSSNSLNFGFSRSSFSLYGGPQPALQRSISKVGAGVNTDMYLGELPLAFGLDFNDFSVDDYWHDSQSTLGLMASTQVQMPSGWLGFKGNFMFGSHTLSGPNGGLVTNPLAPPDSAGINRSIYDFRLGASYGNSLMLGSFTYSLGVEYYQYRDDSSNTVAKLYPDVRANYRASDMVSLYASLDGAVRQGSLDEFLSEDRYVDGLFPLVNTQNNLVVKVGSKILLFDGFAFIPQIEYKRAKNLPLFFSDLSNITRLTYANSATITSVSLSADYDIDDLSAKLSLEYQKGTVDSLSTIPNLPPFNADLGLDYRFTKQLNATAHFLFLSSRYSDLSLTRKVNPVGLLDARIAYDFKIVELPVQVFAGGNNLFNEKYYIWQGYQEFPLTLYIGLSTRVF